MWLIWLKHSMNTITTPSDNSHDLREHHTQLFVHFIIFYLVMTEGILAKHSMNTIKPPTGILPIMLVVTDLAEAFHEYHYNSH